MSCNLDSLYYFACTNIVNKFYQFSEKKCCDNIEVSSTRYYQHGANGFYTRQQDTWNERAVYSKGDLYLYWDAGQKMWAVSKKK